jgi:hypothetical protein
LNPLPWRSKIGIFVFVFSGVGSSLKLFPQQQAKVNMIETGINTKISTQHMKNNLGRNVKVDQQHESLDFLLGSCWINIICSSMLFNFKLTIFCWESEKEMPLVEI